MSHSESCRAIRPGPATEASLKSLFSAMHDRSASPVWSSVQSGNRKLPEVVKGELALAREVIKSELALARGPSFDNEPDSQKACPCPFIQCLS